MFEFLRRYKRLKRSRAAIELEEVFMDAVNMPGFRQEMQEGRIERPIPANLFRAFAGLVLLGFLVAAGRLADLQLAHGDEFFLKAQVNTAYPILVSPPRGILYDHHHQKLVENMPMFVISFDPGETPSADEAAGVFSHVTELLGKTSADVADANGLSADELTSRLKERSASQSKDLFLASGELRDAVLEIETHQQDFPGVLVTESSRREYPLGALAGHLLGYVGRPTREDLQKQSGVRPTDIVGKSGLESWYESFLRGSPGRKLIEINAAGEALRERFIVKPKAGDDVELEIDGGLQQFAAETLARHVQAAGKKAGAVVIIDPRDGGVRALVSYPSFDPNVFSQSSNQKAVAALFADPANPFFDRAVGGAYPSGSTIKPIMATAALEEHVIDPAHQIYDPGYISVPNPYDPANPTIFKDWKALGLVDMRRAIAYSANVYFYTIGGGYHDIKGLGIDRINEYLKRFGWGSTLGIDIAGEAPGLIPNPDTKKALRPSDPIWRIGDTYITSIGQGDLQATPLQLAASTAAIANGGTLFRPRLARAVTDESGGTVKEFPPSVIADRLASPDSLEIVREGMRQAVTEGSAHSLNDLFFTSAGKTGTAQTGVYGKNHGWFIGFAPYEQPEIAIAVLVEEGTGGSTDAVPIAKEILYYYFTHTGSAPLTSSQPQL